MAGEEVGVGTRLAGGYDTRTPKQTSQREEEAYVSWVIAASGCLIGILGIGVAFGARLRIAALEQELTGAGGAGARRPRVQRTPAGTFSLDPESGSPH